MQIPRIFLMIFGVLLVIVGVTLCQGVFEPWITSYLFGAMLISGGISTMWIGFTRSYKALLGGGLFFVVAFGASGMILLKQGFFYGDLGILVALVSLWYFFIGLKMSRKETDRLPRSVQSLLGLMMTIFLLEGVYLIIPMPSHFPWIIDQPFVQAAGWVFIGASLFLGWSLLHPTWENGYPQIYALLAFDLLMIGPLCALFSSKASVVVIPAFLVMGVAFVAISGGWAITELVRRFCVIPKNRA